MISLAIAAWLTQAAPVQEWRVVHEGRYAAIAVQVGPEWEAHRRGMVAILLTVQTGADGPVQTWREVAMSCSGQPATATFVQMRREVAANPSAPLNVTMTDEYPPYMGQAHNGRNPIHVAIAALCSPDFVSTPVVRTAWADMLRRQREGLSPR
ncbi:hypothetical protein [Brevundimonas sp. FT23042]|uniref:hypothetical protein n=1 Tax=Brevundimonas sp. FT23042 TaxID=3393749 RepID=UPI003B58A847